MGDELVARDVLVVLAESPGEAGTRRRKRLEAARGEEPGRADVPRIRHHEQRVGGVQRSEAFAALGDRRHVNARASSRFPFSTTGRPCETSTCSTGRSSRGSSDLRRSSCVAFPSHRSGTEAERVVRGARLRARTEQDVADDDGAVLGQPVHGLGRASGLETGRSPRAAPRRRVLRLDAAVPERPLRTGRRPDASLQPGCRPGVVVERQEHVLRAREVGGRIERVDQHEAVGRVDRDRADVLLPVVVPGGPAAEAGGDFLHVRQRPARRGVRARCGGIPRWTSPRSPRSARACRPRSARRPPPRPRGRGRRPSRPA